MLSSLDFPIQISVKMGEKDAWWVGRKLLFSLFSIIVIGV